MDIEYRNVLDAMGLGFIGAITGVSMRKLSPLGLMPTQATPFSAGFDLYSAEAVEILPGCGHLVGTGIAIAMPAGLCGLIMPRSGISKQFPNYITNSPGLIDPDYRGEIMVSIFNHSKETMAILVGQRIAQLLIVKHEAAFVKFIEVREWPDTFRSSGGFGSTGV